MSNFHAQKGKVVDDLFDLEATLAAARGVTGLDDFGPSDFLEPLRNFLLYSKSLPYNEAGLAGHKEQVQRWLINRLRFADDLKRHPEILDEDVSDPIVVLGFPRSGTTMLQRMMSADPNMQALYTWRVLNPAPFPGENPANPEGRIAFAKNVEAVVSKLNPDLFAGHPMLAEDADEDWFLHHLTFQHGSNCLFLPTVPEYMEYLRTLPRLPTYEYVANLIRYLQWQDGGRRGRRWIMKSPVHSGNIDEILTVHPKATFVYPMRDHRTTVASDCRINEVYSCQTKLTSYDPKKIGVVTVGYYGTELQRYHEARQRLGSRLSVLEVPYQEMLKDPIPCIREVYQRAGTELSREGETAILKWIANNPAGKHGKHEYSLERYGLTPEMVDEKFGTIDDVYV